MINAESSGSDLESVTGDPVIRTFQLGALFLSLSVSFMRFFSGWLVASYST